MRKMREISIEITHDCALKCIFCSSKAQHPSPTGELEFERIKQVLIDSKTIDASIFSVSGGETLLYPQIFDVVKFASKLEYQIKLYTSGTVFSSSGKRIPIDEGTFNKLSKLSGGAITIIFDFQSPDEEICNYLMGVDEAYFNVNCSLNNAINQGLRCEFHFVPMKLNYQSLPQIMEMADKIGVTQVNVLRFVPQGRGKENIEDLMLSPKENLELQYLFEDILVSKRYKTTLRLGHPIDFVFLVNPIFKIKCCRGGDDAPLIIPNGDVHMCPAWKELSHLKAGNIFDQSIVDIWKNSPLYTEFRELISKNYTKIIGFCRTCEFLENCKGKCTAQRIIQSGKSDDFPDCLFYSPDPGCPKIKGRLENDK